MKTRNTILAVLAFLCIVVVLVLIMRRPAAHPERNPLVTESNIERVEIGMAMSEIKLIIGSSWKVEQREKGGDPVFLDGAKVDAIYEWDSGSEDRPTSVEIGFKNGKAAVISRQESE